MSELLLSLFFIWSIMQFEERKLYYLLQNKFDRFNKKKSLYLERNKKSDSSNFPDFLIINKIHWNIHLNLKINKEKISDKKKD